MTAVRRITVKIRSNSILWGNFYAFIVMGMITLFFGSSMTNIIAFYNFTYEQGGLILSVFAAGSLVFGFLSGVVGDLIGMKRMLVLAHILFILGLGLVSFSQSAIILYLGVFFIGSGAGACSTSINIIVNDYTHGDGKIMSLLHMCFGVGAFIIPILSTEMIKLGFHWKRVLIFLAILELISIAITIKMTVHSHKSHPSGHRASTKKALVNWRLYIFMAILFFYVGAENALNGWLVIYLTKGLQFSEHFSKQMLTAFWIFMLIGRYLNSIISQKVFKETILLVSSVGAVITMFLFIKASSPISILIITVLMALMFAGVFPITVANANPVIKGSGAAGALLTSGGAMGSILVPYISGRAAEHSGVMGILYTVLITLVAMCIFTVINKKMQTDHELINQTEVIM